MIQSAAFAALSFAALSIAVVALAAPARAAQAPALHGEGAVSVSLGLGKLRARVTAGAPCAPRVPARREWVPGRHETRCERVWVPGEARRVFVPAVFETRFDACGRPYRVCVREGYWTSIVEPGRYETVESRVWVAGHWRWSR